MHITSRVVTGVEMPVLLIEERLFLCLTVFFLVTSMLIAGFSWSVLAIEVQSFEHYGPSGLLGLIEDCSKHLAPCLASSLKYIVSMSHTLTQ